MTAYIWPAHVRAREAAALEAYRATRARAIRRGFTGTWDDPHLRDAWEARITWLTLRRLLDGVERAERLLNEAEKAA